MRRRLTAALFFRLKSIYGTRFTAAWKTEEDWDGAYREWTEGLRDLTPEQFKRGVESCRESEDWPPSIASFRKAALGQVDPDAWRAQGDAYKITDPSKLLAKDRDLEKAKESLGRMKQALKS